MKAKGNIRRVPEKAIGHAEQETGQAEGDTAMWRGRLNWKILNKYRCEIIFIRFGFGRDECVANARLPEEKI
jgi:hypothetical protein